MTNALQLLKDRYLKNIKEKPTIYVGIELEFPIVNCQGEATDINIAKNLLKRLIDQHSFEAEKFDRVGNPIQIKSKENEDRILFEVSYNILEFAFEKATKIQEVEDRFTEYLSVIQSILGEDDHELQGKGIHPFWDKNDNSPVQSPRYEMLMQYLSMSKTLKLKDLHSYPEYGAFICGNQIQLDVSKENFISVINVFNQIEAAKAYLFANSEFPDSSWNTKIARDIFWEQSMHGILQENAGVNLKDFQNEDEFFSYLSKSAIFTAKRGNQDYYFFPIPAIDYLSHEKIKAYNLSGETVELTPKQEDFENHRSYQYQDLTTRGTVEFRSVCAQPFDRTFISAAFHLGILANLENVQKYLQETDFFKKEGRNYKQLRQKFSKKEISRSAATHVRNFANDLIQLAIVGLVARNNGEEFYLKNLIVKEKEE